MKFLKYWAMGVAVVLSTVAIFGLPFGFLWLGWY